MGVRRAPHQNPSPTACLLCPVTNPLRHAWCRFVETERQQRVAVEREMQRLLQDLADIKMDTIAQVGWLA